MENTVREQHHRCKMIENCEPLSIQTVEGGKRWLHCYTINGGTRKERTECYEIKYCPYCGELLTEPEPLTAEELRERDRRPIWISDGSFCGWTIYKAYDAKQVFFDDELNLSVYLKDYGKTWLAFDRESRDISKRLKGN